VDIVHPRVAGIDVHKKIIWVAVRLPGERSGERTLVVKRFSTFWRPLQQMAAWLAGQGVTGPPRAFRTADLELFHAARCRFRYSSWTSCGVL
jgi:hypothetical protein